MSRKPPLYLKEIPDNLSIDVGLLNQFSSLTALLKHFKDEETCHAFLEQQRWNGDPRCPYCGAGVPYRTNRGFKCGHPKCYKKFSVTIGTIYEDTKLPLRIWFGAIYLAKNRLSSGKIAKKLRITQKSAWSILHKIHTVKAPEPQWQDHQSTKINMNDMQENDLSQKLTALYMVFQSRMITVDEMLSRLAALRIYGTLIGDEPGRYAYILNKYTVINEEKKGTQVEIWFEDKDHWKKNVRAAIRYTVRQYLDELRNFEKEKYEKLDKDLEDLEDEDD